jgi:NAD(P)-dependent dehydrogenase (short-subunit alcohol dehydrogenase family)
MEIGGKSVVVTGAASGIGRAMARRFAREQPRRLVLVDISREGVDAVAAELGAEARTCDMGSEPGVAALIREIESGGAGIDLFCGNAGVLRYGGVETAGEEFQRVMDINVMAHVYAARAALPGMIRAGGGYFLITASAAGLLTQLGSLSYSVSKHAALAVAEWIAASYADRGIRVSALCPQAVESNMTAGTDGSVAGVDGMLAAEAVADCVVEGLRAERFLILPHPQVRKYFLNKATDYDRWIQGMSGLQRRFAELAPTYPTDDD